MWSSLVHTNGIVTNISSSFDKHTAVEDLVVTTELHKYPKVSQGIGETQGETLRALKLSLFISSN